MIEDIINKACGAASIYGLIHVMGYLACARQNVIDLSVELPFRDHLQLGYYRFEMLRKTPLFQALAVGYALPCLFAK